jgi:hypothetical protein
MSMRVATPGVRACIGSICSTSSPGTSVKGVSCFSAAALAACPAAVSPDV